MDHRKPNLESMPMEIQVEIMGHFLKHHGPLILFPQDTYTNQSWAFGSLGILSVSKHLSAIGLSVLYGENSFLIPTSDHRLEEFDDSKKYDVEEGPFTPKHLKFLRWSNLRSLPKDQLTMISSVDCLDLISQTQPGKERVKKVRIELSQYAMMLFLEGSLLRILRKLSGLQSLELELGEGWDTMIPTKGSTKSSQIYDWPERFGRDFLLLVKNELSHIRKITLRPNSWAGDATHIPAWVSYELKKRNRAWVPPPPAYMTFHRTPSSMSVLHSQIIKRIADKEDFFKTKKDVKGVSHLEDAYAVFP